MRHLMVVRSFVRRGTRAANTKGACRAAARCRFARLAAAAGLIPGWHRREPCTLGTSDSSTCGWTAASLQCRAQRACWPGLRRLGPSDCPSAQPRHSWAPSAGQAARLGLQPAPEAVARRRAAAARRRAAAAAPAARRRRERRRRRPMRSLATCTRVSERLVHTELLNVFLLLQCRRHQAVQCHAARLPPLAAGSGTAWALALWSPLVT